MAMRKQGGFTLIELIITLAISAGLIIIALAGFSGVRAQSQFADAVERAKENVLQQRTEANSSVQLAAGNDTSKVFFGRVMTFTRNSSAITVTTLVTDNNDNPDPNQTITTQHDNDLTYTIPWGVQYVGATNKQVAFVRSPADGSLHTVVSNGATFGNHYSDFISATISNTVTNLLLTDDGTRKATIDIDPKTNGVTRTFQ